jgi:hypothetical protein
MATTAFAVVPAYVERKKASRHSPAAQFLAAATEAAIFYREFSGFFANSTGSESLVP